MNPVVAETQRRDPRVYRMLHVTLGAGVDAEVIDSMKIRESGMPEETVLATFFTPKKSCTSWGRHLRVTWLTSAAGMDFTRSW